MGTRIQKALGWGITGLKYDPSDRYYIPTDPRVDMKDFHERKNSGLLTNESWLEWLTQRTAEKTPESQEHFVYTFALHDAQDNVKKDKEPIVNNIVFEGEYGDTGTVLVIPPGTVNFRRFDDPLDYYESYLAGADMSPKVQILDVGIYPWSSTCMRSDTGEDVSDKAKHFRSYIKSLKDAEAKEPHPDNEQTIRLLSKTLADEIKFEGDFEQAVNLLVPSVPLEIKELLAWSGVIKDPKGWKDFRPMIYTWWG